MGVSDEVRPHDRGQVAGARSRAGEDHELAVIMSASSDSRQRDWQAAADHVAGAFVVVVETSGHRYRRRVFLTVKAAETAARRAVDRGEDATVVLAELRPLHRVTATTGDTLTLPDDLGRSA